MSEEYFESIVNSTTLQLQDFALTGTDLSVAPIELLGNAMRRIQTVKFWYNGQGIYGLVEIISKARDMKLQKMVIVKGIQDCNSSLVKRLKAMAKFKIVFIDRNY